MVFGFCQGSPQACLLHLKSQGLAGAVNRRAKVVTSRAIAAHVLDPEACLYDLSRSHQSTYHEQSTMVLRAVANISGIKQAASLPRRAGENV